MDVSWPDPISLWQSQGHSAGLKKKLKCIGGKSTCTCMSCTSSFEMLIDYRKCKWMLNQCLSSIYYSTWCECTIG